jgi:ATP-dependent DNA helicase 2 subunit 1
VLVALAYHNAQLQASAFREEFDPEAFEDLTRPKYDMIHKVSGPYSKSRVLLADVALARWGPYEGVEEGSCE